MANVYFQVSKDISVISDAFEQLTIEDDPTANFSDDQSTKSSGDSVDFPKTKLQKLNEFLQVCKSSSEFTPIGQPTKKWDDMSQRSKYIYINRATDAIVSVLEVVTPGDAASLWEAVQTSHSVDKAFGILHPSEKAYLEALAEAYENAKGVNTKRYILSLMGDLVTLSQIQTFIPGLNRH